MMRTSARPSRRIGLTFLLALFLGAPHLAAAAPVPPADVPQDVLASAWEVVPSPSSASLYGLDMASSSSGWTGGMAGFFFHYNGTDWQPHPTNFASLVNAVDMVNDSSGWGVTWQGEMLRYNGSTWVVHSKPATSALNDLAMLGSGLGFAVGGVGTDGRGIILRYDLGSNSWQPMASPATTWLNAIDMVDANDGWIVGVSGTFLRWNGSSWTGGSLGVPIALAGVDMVNANDGWAVGSNGAMFHWNGTAWTQMPSPTTNSLGGISMVSSDEGWAVGSQGTILYYKNGTWTVAPSPTTEALTAIQMLGPTEGWIVGKSGTILKFVGAHDLSGSTLSVDLHHAVAGQNLKYTVNVRNSGTVTAPAVVVSDVIPSNTNLLPGSIVLSQGSLASTDPFVINLGDVPAGGSASIVFEVEVGNPAACWFAVNACTISCGGDDTARTVGTTVGTCLSTYLPLVVR